MTSPAHACDECGRPRATLYERAQRLVCYYCLPADSLTGARALALILRSVTGSVLIERRRRRLGSSLTK